MLGCVGVRWFVGVDGGVGLLCVGVEEEKMKVMEGWVLVFLVLLWVCGRSAEGGREGLMEVWLCWSGGVCCGFGGCLGRGGRPLAEEGWGEG